MTALVAVAVIGSATPLPPFVKKRCRRRESCASKRNFRSGGASAFEGGESFSMLVHAVEEVIEVRDEFAETHVHAVDGSVHLGSAPHQRCELRDQPENQG